MKKIYTLIAGLLITGGISAQVDIIKSGGFEGTFYTGTQFGQATDNIGVEAVLPAVNWQGIMKQAPAAITGSKSALVMNVNDQDAADALWGTGYNAQTSGIMQQTYKGAALAGIDPNSTSFKFKYKYAPAAIDTAFVLIQIIDSTKASGQQLLWQGFWMDKNTVATATQGSLTTWQQAPNTGTANKIYFTFGSSLNNYGFDNPAPISSEFTVDEVSWVIGNASVEAIQQGVAIVYPNPATSLLNIEVSNANAEVISVFGIDGKIVLTEKLDAVKSTINVSALNNGVYFYNIKTVDGNVLNGSFVKE